MNKGQTQATTTCSYSSLQPCDSCDEYYTISQQYNSGICTQTDYMNCYNSLVTKKFTWDMNTCYPPSSSNTCTDSDNGAEIYTKGYVTGKLNGVSYTQYDVCADTNSVYEYLCSQNNDGTYHAYNYPCFSGQICEDGKCISTCTDTGHGTDLYTAGSATDRFRTAYDSCSGLNGIIKYSCSAGSIMQTNYICPNNQFCYNSKCVSCSSTHLTNTCGYDSCGVYYNNCQSPYNCNNGVCHIPTSEGKCTDTDGNSLTTKGTVTDIISGVTSIYTDYCENKLQVHEYTCNEHMAGNVISCSSGLECNNGICGQPQQTGCNIKGDNEPCGCISDSEFPTIVSNWLNMNGVSDSQFPTAVKIWLDQGCA